MNRFIQKLSIVFLAVSAAAGFGLVTSCNITGGALSGATGGLNLLVTDGPTDDWQEVTVLIKSVSVYNRDGHEWADVWAPDPAKPEVGKVNLVDLSGVSLILQNAQIPVGVYDLLRLVIDTDPATMKLVDDLGNVIPPGQITVVDPSRRGEIRIELSPAVTVVEGETTSLEIDFDLAHPLSIVNLDGRVVVSLKLRHKPMPRHFPHIQFARSIGEITAAAGDGASFTIKTLHEAELTFQVNANTIYVDADAQQPGTFAGLAALVATRGAALVASNMNADGSFYARRVWYAASVDTLPKFTPEGLVRRVGDNWLSILKKRTEPLPTDFRRHRCDWASEVIFVNEDTAWTFRDVPMGMGVSMLRHIARGFRVEVTYVDAEAAPKVAASINVHSAHLEGLVAGATLENFTFGWRDHVRVMAYSGIADHGFGWWFYGLPSGRSAVIQDFVDTVNEARSANLWAFAHAGLYWDADNARWVVENLVLAPMKLHEFTQITTGYTAASGTMGVSTFNCWDDSTPTNMTVALDTAGDLQTVVGSFVWNSLTDLVTFTLPVQPSKWEDLLTPAVNRVKIWVRPVKDPGGTFSWHAYTVIAYQFVR